MSSSASKTLVGFAFAFLTGAGYLQLQASPETAGQVRPSNAAGQAATIPVAATPAASPAAASERALLDKYCVTCHNQRLKTAGLMLDKLDVNDVAAAPEMWEKVISKTRGGLMPPAGRPRPDSETFAAFASSVESALDRAAALTPNPGRVPIHRLNRAEYTNAIRDLLALDIDAQSILPADDSSHGFDNSAGALALSPALLERYLTAAARISRLAVGDPTVGPGFTSKLYEVPINLAQNDRMSEELPFGSRAGAAIHHYFPLDGEYLIKVRLKRSVYEYIVNIDEPHDLDIRLDGHRLERYTIGGKAQGKPAPLSFSGTFVAAGGAGYPTQEWDDYMTRADDGLEIRFSAKAGPHVVGVAFIGKSWEQEGILQPPLREYGATVTEVTDTSSKPEGPGLASIMVDGPYKPTGPGETASRKKIFVCRPAIAEANRPAETACAKKILSSLARRAYRRAVVDADVQPLLEFYRANRQTSGFEPAVQAALERILVDPEFLFRLERDPSASAAAAAYRVSDYDIASRLSFFLWSSIPDDELLDLASSGKLKSPAVIEAQVRRMLADSRSQALVDNFFAQWLSLRSIRGSAPDPNLFPDFDENLRDAFERETKLFIESQLREDRSVLDLLSANYSFLNERLARHYQVPGVVGSRFRRVELPDQRRGGLLGQGSILTVTSYGNRTSPVLRAKWVLDNLLGTPPPSPPPDVPPFPPEQDEKGEPHSVRERLAQHRKNPACGACHAPMDPLGFALENFDAVGHWRTTDANAPIDASGILVDGTKFDGPAELRQTLLARRDQIVRTITEKLLTYALGRGLEYYDAPVVRQIARDAAAHNNSWSSIVLGIVQSAPFQKRRSES
jgi:mono/diheme cytochrome c family protein